MIWCCTWFSSKITLSMIATLVVVSVWMINTGQCIELNGVEMSPSYDAIIFGDIAEIINDIDNNMNLQIDKIQNSESESDEEVESLLSEYQHYLEKAEKQRAKYLVKSKGKNKIPLLHRERYSKINFPKTQNNDRNPNYYTSNIQLSQKGSKRHSYDLFTPIQIAPGEILSPFNKMIWKENKLNDWTSYIHRPGNDVMFSSCFCEENKFPCKCNCKQCIIPLGKKVDTYFEPSKTSAKDNSFTTSSGSYTNTGYFNENIEDKSKSNLNIRIKFDIQLPKIDYIIKEIYKNLCPNKTILPEEMDISDTITPMNLSFPALNFLMPLNIFTYGVSKLHNYGYTPIHKISIHKKKKTHTNYQNKKHRSKFLSLHHGKSIVQNASTPEVSRNDSHNLNIVTKDTDFKIQINTTKESEPSATVNISDVNFVDHGHIFNMSTFLNISNDDNIVEVDTTTLKNSDVHYTRWEKNNTTERAPFLRIKRETKLVVMDNNTIFNYDLLKVRGLNASQSIMMIKNNNETGKRADNKQQLLDSELLYWPNKSGNISKNVSNVPRKVQFSHNESFTEYKMNLNASWQEALSKINWSDIDIATSTFSSLVGKYANGILTVCSEKQCRSLKCTEKLCVHKSCFHEQRYNQRGHCISAPNETESTVSMESNPDVSFDIACELVETLQNQLLGFIYGKATICINIKCITLVANKKMFTKTKCSKKQLNLEGHCESLINTKKN